ncbi:hypothetical protein M405DRAFT_833846 [Rhizopogon salebrosus TDB-379]|nr:hypothetical protein M405DRAFT_833846 [Rhizopogon salebrosus TDB-379]
MLCRPGLSCHGGLGLACQQKFCIVSRCMLQRAMRHFVRAQMHYYLFHSSTNTIDAAPSTNDR